MSYDPRREARGGNSRYFLKDTELKRLIRSLALTNNSIVDEWIA